MTRLSHGVIRHRKAILIITLLVCALCAVAMQAVEVNYNFASYLPKSSPTTIALGLMDSAIPNLEVYLPGKSVQEALQEKQKLLEIPGVQSVLWLDDAVDLRATPFAMVDAGTSASFYQEGPLYQLTLTEKNQADTVVKIRERYPDALLRGEAADQEQVINATMMQVASILLYVVPVCLLILVLATRHWLEPLLFILAIGIAILINEGTNLFLGKVSFITRACSAILQLAVSIDYAVFLLHRFSELRDEGHKAAEAMQLALQKSASAIFSSALTTIFGFLVLILMDFSLGRDMGIVLAKGVVFSYLSVIIILPALTLAMEKAIQKTRHRSFLPSFQGFGRFVVRFAMPLALVVLLVLPLAFLAQGNNRFIYGSGGMHSDSSSIRQEGRKIEERFGNHRMMLVMVPEGQPAMEKALSMEILKLPGIESVVSYATAVSPQIPPSMLEKQMVAPFYQDGFARLILTTNTLAEGRAAFDLVDQVRALAQKYYEKDSHLMSESAVNLDLKESITGDSLKVLLAGLVSIGLILLINFQSLTIPLILLTVIQGSIWLNMAFPYFLGEPLNYIGYQIVSSVQLGATIDYGILLTQRYLEGRKTRDKKQAAVFALQVSTGAILPPALILTAAGYLLGLLVQDNQIIRDLGIVIGRGAAVSASMVLLVLPCLLIWCDGLIQKTTRQKGGNP